MYEALYRKYRPQTFDDVVGQQHITETLKMQIRTDRLSHAYLFIGTRGTGKTTCARILAKAVNCEHPVNGNPCNECESCRSFDEGTLLDVTELDAASNNGVDDVRLLRDEAVFSPTRAKKRVYIIDEVHMLSKPAFNALLKILEEPPEHLMFILATTELNKVLPTILSRCQRHSFRRMDAETVAAQLLYVAGREGIDLTGDAAMLLGRLADGGMRDGLSLLDQCASRERVDTEAVLSAMGLAGSYAASRLADCISAHDTEGALLLFRQLWQEGKDPASLLSELANLWRDALMLRLAPKGGGSLLSGLYGADVLSSLRLNSGELLMLLNVVQKYQSGMKDAPNVRLQCELCLVELCGMKSAEGRYVEYLPAEKNTEMTARAPAAETPQRESIGRSESSRAGRYVSSRRREEQPAAIPKNGTKTEERPPLDETDTTIEEAGKTEAEAVRPEEAASGTADARENPDALRRPEPMNSASESSAALPEENEEAETTEEEPSPAEISVPDGASDDLPPWEEEEPCVPDTEYGWDGDDGWAEEPGSAFSDSRDDIPPFDEADVPPEAEETGVYAAPASGEDESRRSEKWYELVEKLGDELPIHINMCLLNDSAVRGSWEDGVLVIRAHPTFYFDAFNHSDILDTFSRIAGVPVRLEKMGGEEQKTDSVDDLSRFGSMVKFV